MISIRVVTWIRVRSRNRIWITGQPPLPVNARAVWVFNINMQTILYIPKRSLHLRTEWFGLGGGEPRDEDSYYRTNGIKIKKTSIRIEIRMHNYNSDHDCR